MKSKFARFVVRDASGLILGKSFGGLLKPGRVYQIVEILDELMIKDMGPSALNKPSLVASCSWDHEASGIVENGHHLHTRDEFKLLCKRGR